MDDKIRDWIEFLEREWEVPNGFFVKARGGIFDSARGEAVYEMLKTIRLPVSELFDRRLERKLVSKLWIIPAFLEWQEKRGIDRSGGDVRAYGILKVRITEAIGRIFRDPDEALSSQE